MVLGLVAVMAANLAESVYIGFVGTLELAALGFTFPLVMLMQSMSMGLAVGASSVVARSIGANDHARAKIILTHSLLLTIIFVSLIAIVLFPNLESLFQLLGAGGEALPLAVEYMQVWFLGLPFFSIAMVGSQLMRSAGDVKKPGYLMVVGAALQILCGPIFIFGLGGAPELGLLGAAVGFVVARFFGFLLYIYYIYVDRLIVGQLTGFLSSCRDIFHVGLPAIASNLIGPLSFSIITRLIAGHGTAFVAGFSLASRIETMLAMVIWALSMSIAPFVGQNWGANEFGRVRKSLRTAHFFALGWGLFSFIILAGLGPFAVAAVNNDSNVVEAAFIYLLIAPIGIGFMGVLSNSTNSFNALGQPKPPLIISVVQTIFVSLPLAVLGNYLFGFPGIFIGGTIAMILSSVVAFYWLRIYIRKEESDFEREGLLT